MKKTPPKGGVFFAIAVGSAGNTMNLKHALLAVILSLTVVSYTSGLFGGFLFDDYQNIVENAAIQNIDGSASSWLAAALSSGSGMLRRPISMLSFALNDYFLGMSAPAFKSVNLAIHLLVGFIVYLLFRRLIPRLLPADMQAWPTKKIQMTSILIAGLWLLHPLNVSSVLYVVQRMNQLSTLFILVGILAYVIGRLRALNGKPGLLVALTLTFISGLLATLSKENGALIFLYIFIIEWICFRFLGLARSEKIVITLYFFIFLAIPATTVIISLYTNPDWLLGSYQIRDYTLPERLMTQTRVLGYYLLWILAPFPSLMGIYHDYIAVSTGIFSPPTTAICAIIIVALITCAYRNRVKQPAFAFAIFWYLAGHSMESTVIALEQVFEHRNYLPMVGLLAGLTIVIANRIPRFPVKVQAAFAATALAFLAIGTAARATTWSDPIRLAVTSAKHHPESARSQYDAGRMVYMAAMNANNEHRAIAESAEYFERAAQLSDSYIHPIISIMLTQHRGTKVPPALMAELIERIRKVKLMQPTPLFQLQEAITNGRVLATADDMLAIFEAAMENPSTNSAARAQLLNNYGRYHFVTLKNSQMAVSLTLAAAAQSPANPVYQINLARLALALNDKNRARHHLKKAESLDVARINSDAIESVRNTVEASR